MYLWLPDVQSVYIFVIRFVLCTQRLYFS